MNARIAPVLAALLLCPLWIVAVAAQGPGGQGPGVRPAPLQRSTPGGQQPGRPGGDRPGGGGRPQPVRPRPPQPQPGRPQLPRPQPPRPQPPRPQPPRPGPGGGNNRPGRPNRPPQWGRPPQRRPSYHFRPGDRAALRRHYLRHLAYINRARRPVFTVGGYFPYGDIGYLTPLSASLYPYIPPPPPGYQVGYFDGYVVVYDPVTYFIADLIDLLQ